MKQTARSSNISLNSTNLFKLAKTYRMMQSTRNWILGLDRR